MSSHQMEDKILSIIEEKKEEIIELLRTLIRIPSLTGEEGAAQEFFAHYLKNVGMDINMWEPDIQEIFTKFPEVAQYPSHWMHDLILPYKGLASYDELIETGKIEILNYKDRPNVVATWKGRGGGKSLLLTGHIDNVTVEPKSEWNDDPFGAGLHDGKIYGRGSSDMKGGLIAAISAIQCLIEAGVSLKGDVLFASVVNEEHSGNGTLSMVCKGIKTDAAIVTEPSGNQIFIATPGDVYWHATLRGIPRSPGARWEGQKMVGVSAIEKLPLIIKSLLDLETDHNRMSPHPLYAEKNPFSCVIGEVSGGTYTTVTAHQCSLRGCIYFSPGIGSVKDIMDQIKEYIEKGTQADPWFKDHPVETSFLHHRNCSVVDKNQPIVKTIYDSTRMASNKTPVVIGSPYCADMDILVNQGKIPTVIVGPGSIAYAHKANECIPIDEMIACVKTLALAIYKWCG